MVARLVRDQEAVGSNPVSSTKKYQQIDFADIFLSKPQVWYIITPWRVYHFAKGEYIISRRLYTIITIAMMICNTACIIDQAFLNITVKR